jgi:hypothetical protein
VAIDPKSPLAEVDVDVRANKKPIERGDEVREALQRHLEILLAD